MSQPTVFVPPTSASAEFAAAVTPSDSTAFTSPTRAFLAGVAGNVAVEMNGDGAAITIPVQAGVMYPIRAKKVLATGTTATGIIAFW